jgi:hypothetical protein
MTDLSFENPSSLNEDSKEPDYPLKLCLAGDTIFLDHAVAQELKARSGFLKVLFDPSSNFMTRDLQTGCFVVEHPSAEFVHLLIAYVKFGDGGVFLRKKEQFLQDADFWDVGELVRNAIDESELLSNQKLLRKITEGFSRSALMERLRSQMDSQIHHNHRRDDGNGRVYCEDCGNRDFDLRWRSRKMYALWCGECREQFTDCSCSNKKEGIPESLKINALTSSNPIMKKDLKFYGVKVMPVLEYANCEGCHKKVLFKHNLGWCHKCQMCKSCQRDGKCQQPNLPSDSDLKSWFGL